MPLRLNFEHVARSTLLCHAVPSASSHSQAATQGPGQGLIHLSCGVGRRGIKIQTSSKATCPQTRSSTEPVVGCVWCAAVLHTYRRAPGREGAVELDDVAPAPGQGLVEAPDKGRLPAQHHQALGAPVQAVGD